VEIEEAKKKWCPMVRFQIGPHNERWQNMAIDNRGDLFEPKKTVCLADQCAVWVTDTAVSGHCGLIR